ncbi:unnamed protein product [Paramecium sonneborni]|uniref:Uncharacterized protein n=1 Tax=Paramecium sonneborni TaxID=65129 RepID=A0A8S1P0M7_9CILI|nr:unnamed protein product [Paramecium sonneborni]
MNKTLLISVCLLSITTAVTVDRSVRCDCSELDQNGCGKALSWCIWNTNDKECEEWDLECEDFSTSASCDVVSGCKWQDSLCKEWDPECKDLTTSADCKKASDCYWNKNNACASFSKCDDYAEDNCPYSKECTVSSGSCVAVTYVTCSSQQSGTCSGYQSNTQYCALDNSNSCKAVSYSGSCSDYNDFTNICNQTDGCFHEGQTCRQRKCADQNTSNECRRISLGDKKYQLCFWKDNNACVDATDTSGLTEETCYSSTYYNYKWESGKCVECEDLVDVDSDSNGLIIGAFVLLSLFA